MRWLLAIAFILGTWSAAALCLVDYSNAVGLPPPSAFSAQMARRKRERTHVFYGTGITVAAACLGLAMLIGLGKRVLTKKPMARSSGASVPPDVDIPQTP